MLIYCFMCFPLLLGVLCLSLFWYALLCVLSSVVLIYCFMCFPLLLGVLCLSLFWYALLCVLSSFAINLKRKRELFAFIV